MGGSSQKKLCLARHGTQGCLKGWCLQQAVGWESFCTSSALCASPSRAISEPAWGDSGWKISGLPEQLIQPTDYSLVTPFLRIPETQAARTQAGRGIVVGCSFFWEPVPLAVWEEGKLFPHGSPQGIHLAAWLAALHPVQGRGKMKRVIPRGPFWQQVSLVPGVHGAARS